MPEVPDIFSAWARSMGLSPEEAEALRTGKEKPRPGYAGSNQPAVIPTAPKEQVIPFSPEMKARLAEKAERERYEQERLKRPPPAPGELSRSLFAGPPVVYVDAPSRPPDAGFVPMKPGQPVPPSTEWSASSLPKTPPLTEEERARYTAAVTEPSSMAQWDDPEMKRRREQNPQYWNSPAGKARLAEIESKRKKSK